MLKDRERNTGYVRKVQEDTKRYVERLLKENETLRALLARIQNEKLSLEEQILIMREQLDRQSKEGAHLQRQITEIEADHRRFNEEYEAIEHQNSNLANLYVASYRLHGTLDRDEVLSTILEILINLVGAEEVGVFELDPEKLVLGLATSYGIDEGHHSRIPLGEGVIGRVGQTGDSFFGEGNGGEDDDLTACIALKVDGRVTGAITVFSLLPQKKRLESVDHELFELLATHAATAIYCTTLHARSGDRVGVS
jgi:nitrate/nitrite-specific signal transduction histidine kinase